MPKGWWLGAALLATSLMGCAGDTTVSKDQDKQLRGNFDRPLNAEELKQMGGGGKTAGGPSGPNKKGGG